MGKRWAIAGLVGLTLFLCFQGAAGKGKNALPAFSDPEAAQPVQTQPALEFPCVLRGTELIAEHLARYDGPFLEGETEEPVTAVAALMIYNPTGQGISALEVEVEQGGEILSFYLTYLPPQSRVLVLERQGKPYSSQPVASCRCVQISRQSFDMQENRISVTEEGGKLRITNLTGETLSHIVLLHKQYHSAGGFYLGGITYETVVEKLLPGEGKEILPKFYARGGCRVVAVQAKNKLLWYCHSSFFL